MYCPLKWMFYNIEKTQKRLCERRFRVVYLEATSSSEELLEKDSSVSIYYRKIRFLNTEMLRVYKWISTKIMTGVFPQMEPLNYKISKQSDFSTRPVKSAYDSIEPIGYL